MAFTPQKEHWTLDVTRSVRLNKGIDDEFMRYVKESNTNVNAVIKKALNAYLAAHAWFLLGATADP